MYHWHVRPAHGRVKSGNPLRQRRGQMFKGELPLDPREIRKDFPVLDQDVNGHPLAYLDNAATSQRPSPVVRAVEEFYDRYNANVHRGIHKLSEEASEMYENARAKVAEFIGAPNERTLIYTRNSTESINLVAYSWGMANLKPGDEVLVTEMEHHANLVPWQLLCQRTGATYRYIPIDDTGHLRLDLLDELLTERTKLFAFTAASNVLGTINPVKELVAAAHRVGALALVDAAQAAPHIPIDVQEWDCDFLAFSGHKMLGPTGIGFLYGKEEILDSMPPFMAGGDMIREVHIDSATWNDLPWKFEAGTPNIAGAIGMGVAVDYLRKLGMDKIHAQEQALIGYAMERLAEVPGLTMYGPPADERGGLVAFTVEGIHPHDLASILDAYGVAVRAGHHCAQPVHDHFGIPATARASFYIYNTPEEADALVNALMEARKLFRLG